MKKELRNLHNRVTKTKGNNNDSQGEIHRERGRRPRKSPGGKHKRQDVKVIT